MALALTQEELDFIKQSQDQVKQMMTGGGKPPTPTAPPTTTTLPQPDIGLRQGVLPEEAGWEDAPPGWSPNAPAPEVGAFAGDDGWEDVPANEQGWEDVPQPNRGLGSELAAGVQRGWEGAKGLGHALPAMAASALEKTIPGLAGETTAAVKKWGYGGFLEHEEAAKEYAPSVEKFTSINDLKSAGQWTAGTFGSLVPSMVEGAASAAIGALATGPMAPAGAVGGIVAKTTLKGFVREFAKQAVKEGMEKKAAQLAGKAYAANMLKNVATNQFAKQQVKKAMAVQGAKFGTIAGVGLGMEAPGNWAEGVQQGFDNPFTAMATGLASGYIETIGGNFNLIKKIIGPDKGKALKAALDVAESGNRSLVPDALRKVASFAKEAIANGAEEFGQEAMQEISSLSNIAMNDPTFEAFTKENLGRVFESGMAGFVGGMGGQFVSRGVDIVRGRKEESGEEVQGPTTRQMSYAIGTPDERMNLLAEDIRNFHKDAQPLDPTQAGDVMSAAKQRLDTLTKKDGITEAEEAELNIITRLQTEPHILRAMGWGWAAPKKEVDLTAAKEPALGDAAKAAEVTQTTSTEGAKTGETAAGVVAPTPTATEVAEPPVASTIPAAEAVVAPEVDLASRLATLPIGPEVLGEVEGPTPWVPTDVEMEAMAQAYGQGGPYAEGITPAVGATGEQVAPQGGQEERLRLRDVGQGGEGQGSEVRAEGQGEVVPPVPPRPAPRPLGMQTLSASAPTVEQTKGGQGIEVVRAVPPGVSEEGEGRGNFWTTDATFAQEFVRNQYGIEPEMRRTTIAPERLFDHRDDADSAKVWPILVRNIGAEKAKRLLDQVREGSWAATESGEFQRALQEAGYEYATMVESGALNFVRTKERRYGPKREAAPSTQGEGIRLPTNQAAVSDIWATATPQNPVVARWAERGFEGPGEVAVIGVAGTIPETGVRLLRIEGTEATIPETDLVYAGAAMPFSFEQYTNGSILDPTMYPQTEGKVVNLIQMNGVISKMRRGMRQSGAKIAADADLIKLSKSNPSMHWVLARTVAKAMGAKGVVFYEGPRRYNGTYVDGWIAINDSPGVSVLHTLFHELTHDIQRRSETDPEVKKIYEKYVIDVGMALDAAGEITNLVSEKLMSYGPLGLGKDNVSIQEALDEIFANVNERAIQKVEFWQYLEKHNASLFEKMINLVKNMLVAIKQHLSGEGKKILEKSSNAQLLYNMTFGDKPDPHDLSRFWKHAAELFSEMAKLEGSRQINVTPPAALKFSYDLRAMELEKEVNDFQTKKKELIEAGKPPKHLLVKNLDYKIQNAERMLREYYMGKGRERLPYFSIEKVSANVNKERVADILGQQLYGDLGQMATTTIKEVFQNSFDGIKDAMARGIIDKGKIEIRISNNGRIITVIDNGNGMSLDVFKNAFLTIAGTNKESNRPSGSWGVAKGQFLFANEGIIVETVRDGKRIYMDEIGKNIHESLAGVRELKIEYDDAPGVPNGTRIQIRIPENYVDQNTGVTKPVAPFEDYSWRYESLKHSPLFENIDVEYYYNGTKQSQAVEVGNSFPMDKYSPFAKVNFVWGDARIIVEKEENGPGYGDNVHVLSNGIYQFSTKIAKKPSELWGAPIPRTIYINLEPKIRAGEPGYPFALNRQNFSPTADADMKQILNYIWAIYNKGESHKVASGYGKMYSITQKGTIRKGINLTPSTLAGIVDETFETTKEDVIEIREGRLWVNNRQMPELTMDAVKNLALQSDIGSFKIEQSTVDPDHIFARDNTFIPSTGDRTTGKGLIEAAIEQFGEQRVNTYLYKIAKQFRDLRDVAVEEIEHLEGENQFTRVAQTIPVGIDIDTKHHGVHIKVPFQGMFLNPVQPFMDQTPEIAARALVDTMVHELAHAGAFSHDADFAKWLSKLNIVLSQSKKFSFVRATTAMANIRKENQDIVSFMEGQYGNVRVRDESFKDARGQERDFADIEELRRTVDGEGATKLFKHVLEGSGSSRWVEEYLGSLNTTTGREDYVESRKRQIKFKASDIQKLSQRLPDITLDQFARIFAPELDRVNALTMQDVDAAALSFMATAYGTPDKVIAGGKKIAPGLIGAIYKKIIQSKMLDNAINRLDADEVEVRVWQSIQQGHFDSTMDRVANEAQQVRRNALLRIIDTLNRIPSGTAEGQVPNHVKAVIVTMVGKYNVAYEKNGEWKARELADNNSHPIMTIDAPTIHKIYEVLKAGKSVKSAFIEGVKWRQEEMQKKINTQLNGWTVLPQKANSEAAGMELREATALAPSWCISNSADYSRSYRASGPFHIYYEGGVPVIGISTHNGSIREPPRGNTPDQKLRGPREEKIAADYLESGAVAGGQRYIRKNKLREAVKEILKTGNVPEIFRDAVVQQWVWDGKTLSAAHITQNIEGLSDLQLDQDIKDKVMAAIVKNMPKPFDEKTGIFHGDITVFEDLPPYIKKVKGDVTIAVKGKPLSAEEETLDSEAKSEYLDNKMRTFRFKNLKEIEGSLSMPRVGILRRSVANPVQKVSFDVLERVTDAVDFLQVNLREFSAPALKEVTEIFVTVSEKINLPSLEKTNGTVKFHAGRPQIIFRNEEVQYPLANTSRIEAIPYPYEFAEGQPVPAEAEGVYSESATVKYVNYKPPVYSIPKLQFAKGLRVEGGVLDAPALVESNYLAVKSVGNNYIKEYESASAEAGEDFAAYAKNFENIFPRLNAPNLRVVNTLELESVLEVNLPNLETADLFHTQNARTIHVPRLIVAETLENTGFIGEDITFESLECCGSIDIQRQYNWRTEQKISDGVGSTVKDEYRGKISFPKLVGWVKPKTKITPPFPTEAEMKEYTERHRDSNYTPRGSGWRNTEQENSRDTLEYDLWINTAPEQKFYEERDPLRLDFMGFRTIDLPVYEGKPELRGISVDRDAGDVTNLIRPSTEEGFVFIPILASRPYLFLNNKGLNLNAPKIENAQFNLEGIGSGVQFLPGLKRGRINGYGYGLLVAPQFALSRETSPVNYDGAWGRRMSGVEEDTSSNVNDVRIHIEPKVILPKITYDKVLHAFKTPMQQRANYGHFSGANYHSVDIEGRSLKDDNVIAYGSLVSEHKQEIKDYTIDEMLKELYAELAINGHIPEGVDASLAQAMDANTVSAVYDRMNKLMQTISNEGYETWFSKTIAEFEDALSEKIMTEAKAHGVNTEDAGDVINYLKESKRSRRVRAGELIQTPQWITRIADRIKTGDYKMMSAMNWLNSARNAGWIQYGESRGHLEKNWHLTKTPKEILAIHNKMRNDGEDYFRAILGYHDRNPFIGRIGVNNANISGIISGRIGQEKTAENDYFEAFFTKSQKQTLEPDGAIAEQAREIIGPNWLEVVSDLERRAMAGEFDAVPSPLPDPGVVLETLGDHAEAELIRKAAGYTGESMTRNLVWFSYNEADVAGVAPWRIIAKGTTETTEERRSDTERRAIIDDIMAFQVRSIDSLRNDTTENLKILQEYLHKREREGTIRRGSMFDRMRFLYGEDSPGNPDANPGHVVNPEKGLPESTLRFLKMFMSDLPPRDMGRFESMYTVPFFFAKEHPSFTPIFNVQRERTDDRNTLNFKLITTQERDADGDPIGARKTNFFLDKDKLPKEKRDKLFKLIIESDEENRVMSDEELKARGMDESQINGYKAWIKGFKQAFETWLEAARYAAHATYRHRSWYQQELQPHKERSGSFPESNLSVVAENPNRKDYYDIFTAKMSEEEKKEFDAAVRHVRQRMEGINKYRNQFKELNFYMPRFRDQGEIVTRVWEGKPGDSDVLESVRSEYVVGANKDKNTLTAKYPGKAVTQSREPVTPESMFEELSPMKLERFIQESLARAKNQAEISDEVLNAIQESIFETIANELNARGFMQRSIHRRGGNFVITVRKKDGTLVEHIPVDALTGEESQVQLEDGSFRDMTDAEYLKAYMAKVKDLTSDTEADNPEMIVSAHPRVIKGYKVDDPIAIFHQYMSGLAGFLSKKKAAIHFFQELRNVGQDMQERTTPSGRKYKIRGYTQPRVYEYAHQYIKDMLRNQDRMDILAGRLRLGAYLYNISGKLSAAAVNLTQPFVTAIPVFARLVKQAKKNGAKFPNANFAYTKAMNDVLRYEVDRMNKRKNSSLSEEEQMLLKRAQETGEDTAQYLNEVMGTTDANLTGYAQRFLRIISGPFAAVEAYNRKVAMVAAMRLEMAINPRTEEKKDSRKSIERFDYFFSKAVDFSNQVNFVMGKANLPEWARSGSGLAKGLRTAYTFRGFNHNYVLLMKEYLRKDAEGKRNYDVLMRSLGFLALFGGMAGVPFWNDLMELIEKWGKVPVRAMLRKHARAIGTWADHFMTAGLPGLFGFDLSGSLAMGIPLANQANLEDSIYGVYGGMMQRGMKAMDAASRYDYARAVEYAAPMFVGNPIRAYRESTRGVTSSFGTPLYQYGSTNEKIKLTPGEAALRFAGFRPIRESVASQEKRSIEVAKKSLDDRRQTILDRIELAKTPAERAKIIKEEVPAFNRSLIKTRGLASRITAESISRVLNKKPSKPIMRYESGNLTGLPYNP